MKINKFTPDMQIFNNDTKNKINKNNDNSFSDFMKQKLDDINDKQITAEKSTERFVRGEENNIHNVMLATAEARLSLDMAIEVRNKMVEAYQELNRMQI